MVHEAVESAVRCSGRRSPRWWCPAVVVHEVVESAVVLGSAEPAVVVLKAVEPVVVVRSPWCAHIQLLDFRHDKHLLML